MTVDRAPARGSIRTVLGDRDTIQDGSVYCHEHLIIDSPLIADRFPHILLCDADAAIREVKECVASGTALMVDTMPMASGRDAVRLARVAAEAGVDIVAVTGLHHDRYYGPLHWTNRVSVDQLVEQFVADLIDGIDEFDGTSPIVRRTTHRAGVVKVATSGARLDARDERNLEAVALASVQTGAPVMTHCEGGLGGVVQVERLSGYGVPADAIMVCHVDKARDFGYLLDLAQTGAVLELDQTLRLAESGVDSACVRAVAFLFEHGYGQQVVVGTDGARRTLWKVYGGWPGLAWLAAEFPALLAEAGISFPEIVDVMRANALRVLRWRPAAGSE